MIIRRNVDDLCKLTGLDRKEIQRVLEKGVEIGALKKISDEDYEMTDMGINIGSKININNYKTTDPGVWTCTKCKIVNNALNDLFISAFVFWIISLRLLSNKALLTNNA